MMLRPKLHDHYIARMVIMTVLAAWGVLLGLDVVLAFADEFGDVGKGGYTMNHAIAATCLTIPWRAYNLFPTSAVIGSLQLAATSELTALRALGLSRRRLSVSVALPLALLTLLMVANGEALAPWGEERAQSLKSARNTDMVVAEYSGLWAREGDMFLNARSGEQKARDGDTWLELRGVRLFQFDRDGRLRDVERTSFSAKSVSRARVAEERWDSKLDEAALAANVTKPRNMGSGELRESIDYRKRNRLEAGDFEEVYWGRWFYPLNVLTLCLAAIPFAFGTLRSGGYGKRLFLGIVFALGFYTLQRMATELAGIYHFDYRIAFALPPAIMLAVSLWLFKRRSG